MTMITKKELTEYLRSKNKELEDKLEAVKKHYEKMRARYVMFSPEIQEKVSKIGDLRSYLKSVDLEELQHPRDIVKYALHGFWGDVHELLRLYRDVETEYLCKHMTRIRESLRQKKTPRQMETLKRRVKVRWEDEIGFCGLKKDTASKTYDLCSDQCFTCPYITS